MLGKNYKTHKENILNIYHAYKAYRGDINDGVNIKFLQNRIESLAKNKFTLAVAGEVKAGKSTFLNALLGQELLPSDVLQATSAVIEICKSDKKFLKIEYADNTKEEFTVNCKEKLKEICSINDEYRVIPFTQINNYIQNSENLLFTDLDLELLERNSGISKLKLIGNKSLIEKYIKETPKNKLPISISLGFPLKWDFDELRLVDCPGINANGGVQNLSYEYFTKANAIIFVHPVKPVESKSFSEFVTEVIPDKNKSNLFLVLTHADHHDDEEVERLTNEAKRLYGDHINPQHIVAVDSILSLIHRELEDGIPLKKIRQESKQKKKAIASHKEDAEDEGKELTDVLKHASGFEKMYRILDEYSLRAPNLQLKEILETIQYGYEELDKIYKRNIQILEQKKKSPQSFSEEIERLKEKLDEYQNLLGKGSEHLEEKYSGVNTKIYKSLNDTVNRFTEKIRESNSLVFIRKISTDAENAFKDNLNEFVNEITFDLKSIMEAIAKDFESNQNIIVPKIDLKAIELKTKKDAFKTEDIIQNRPDDFWDKITFGLLRKYRENEKKVGEKKVYDEVKHLEKIKSEIYHHFKNIRKVLFMKSGDLLEKYLKDFQSEFVTEIHNQKLSLTELKERKNDNEAILMEINSLKKKNSNLPKELKSVKEIINDIA